MLGECYRTGVLYNMRLLWTITSDGNFIQTSDSPKKHKLAQLLILELVHASCLSQIFFTHGTNQQSCE